MLRCNYLQKLYVNYCQIDSNGVEHIAEALIKNQSLFLLHLSKNQIGEAGALSLAKMIAKNRVLKKLMVVVILRLESMEFIILLKAWSATILWKFLN